MRSAILAGGHATRFGGKPKGLEKVGGERILDRVAQAVRAATGGSPTLIANAPEAAEWLEGTDVVADAVENAGALGGLYTAVVHGEGPVLVVAWDMPFIPVELLETLIRRSEGHDLFLPESTGPQGIEPLCGVYGAACAAAIKAQLDDEDYRATGFHDRVEAATLPLEDVRAIGDPGIMFFNVNTAQDLKTAEEKWRSEHA